MSIWRLQPYRAEGSRKNIDPALLDTATSYCRNITQTHTHIYPILTLRHLSSVTNVKYSYLRHIVGRTASQSYRVFYIKKRNFDLIKNPLAIRRICVPSDELMIAQKFINNHILQYFKIHKKAYSYTKDRSILDAAYEHCACRWLIKIDIRNFFDSINEKQVYETFVGHGFPPLISFELARICTYPTTSFQGVERNNFYTINQYLKAPKGALPQGAPTSPALSNIISFSLDEQITEFSTKNKLNYTRYADDIFISSNSKSFDRRQAIRTLNSIFNILRSNGFNPNKAKSKIYPPGSNKIILGLSINSSTPKLTEKFKSNLNLHLYYLMKFGPVNHSKKRGFSSTIGLKNHINGLISYAKQIDQNYGEKVAAQFKSICWPI